MPRLKLTFKRGDAVRLIDATGASVECVIDATRAGKIPHTPTEGAVFVAPGVRLLITDDEANGIDAWLSHGDRVHLDGYFDHRVTIEIASMRASECRLLFTASAEVRIVRVPLDERVAPAPAPESEVTAPTNPLPIDPGDVCLCTWPSGVSETVEVLAFQANNRVAIRIVDPLKPDPIPVPLSFLAPLTH